MKTRNVTCLSALCLLATFLVGCAGTTLQSANVTSDAVATEEQKQKEMAFANASSRTERILNVSYPLRRAACDLANKSDRRKTFGIVFHQIADYGRQYRECAIRRYGPDPQVSIRYVHPDFPAAQAGLRAGDKVITVNGNDVRKAKTKDVMGLISQPSSSRHTTWGERSRKPTNPDSLFITVERDSVQMDFALEGVDCFRSSVLFAEGDDINAYADGENVVILSGMLRFVESDEELALVVGHELAHNLLGHIDKRRSNSIFGALADIAAAATLGVNTGGAFTQAAGSAFSQDFEFEADYAGLYIAARCGYNIERAPDFWRRMAVEHPGSIKKNFTASHPSTPERFVALESAVTEIREKEERGEPLVPNSKDAKSEVKPERRIGGK